MSNSIFCQTSESEGVSIGRVKSSLSVIFLTGYVMRGFSRG